MAFQRSVNRQPAPAIEGDFASSNPYRSMIAGPGELTVGAAGLTLGKFAFARNDNGVTSNAHPGVPCRVGFAQREQPVLITAWLGAASMLMPAGLECTLHDGGDFWARFAAGAVINQKVIASFADGSVTSGAAVPTAAATASFATNVMTVTVPGGYLAPGAPVTSAGVAAGTYITQQLTGAAGGAGTYQLSTAPGTIASQAATVGLGYDTGFIVQSTAAAGEIAKIARIPSNAA